MSQSELAGGEVSPSYISLVESGRRTPSPAIARAIGERLGVPLDEFGLAAAAEPGRDERTDLVRRLVVARSARAENGFGFAADELVALIEVADDRAEHDIAWEARWELAETYGELDRPADREDVLRGLLDNPLTASSPRLRARVAAAIAELALSRGKLADAVRAAEQAASAADALDVGAHEWGRSRLALVAAYTGHDDLDRADAAAADLLASLDDLPTNRLRGLACWTAAELRVAQGRPDEAVPLLRQAADLLPPRDDPGQSARLALTTIRVRLATESAPDAVDEPLAWARQAVALVGTDADRARLAAVEGRVLAAMGELDAALARIADIRPTRGLPPLELADCLLAAGEIQRAAGHQADAEKSYRQAAELFEEVAAYRLAAVAWRTLADLVAGRRPL